MLKSFYGQYRKKILSIYRAKLKYPSRQIYFAQGCNFTLFSKREIRHKRIFQAQKTRFHQSAFAKNLGVDIELNDNTLTDNSNGTFIKPEADLY